MRILLPAIVFSLCAPAAEATRIKHRASAQSQTRVSSRARVRAARPRPAARPAAQPAARLAPPPVVSGAPVAVGPVNPPHGRGRTAAFAHAKAAPPPSPAELAPIDPIGREFLQRIAARHAAAAEGVKVKATRADRVKDFDPDREGDTEIVVIQGDSSGGHNRDQGGKPAGKKN